MSRLCGLKDAKGEAAAPGPRSEGSKSIGQLRPWPLRHVFGLFWFGVLAWVSFTVARQASRYWCGTCGVSGIWARFVCWKLGAAAGDGRGVYSQTMGKKARWPV